MSISSLGYVGIGAKDPQEWFRLCTQMIGMMPARALPGESWGIPADPNDPGPASGGSGMASDGSMYFKLDEFQWRLAVHPSETPGLLYTGLQIDSEVEFTHSLREIAQAGVKIEEASAREAAARSVRRLAHLEDPAANRLELFFGPTRDRKFVSPLQTRFFAGKLGFGHLNLFVDDMEANYDFYTRVLGFRLSDYMILHEQAGMSVQFLGCNARHHTIGLIRVGDFCGLQHLMIEVENIDDVGRVLDRVQRAGYPITSTLGRHANDNMLSFYMRGPSGFDVEIGCEGLLIDESWVPNQFCEGDVWGHQGLTAESISAMADELKTGQA